MKKTLASLLVACLFLSTSAHAVGLRELYLQAMDNDPDFASARFAQIAGQENRNIGRAALLPTLQGTLSATDVSQQLAFANSANGNGSRDYVSKTRSLSLSQPLFNLQKFKDFTLGDVRAELADAQFAEAQQALILRVSQAYFAYLLAQDTLELNTAQKVSLAAQALQAERLYKGGVATVTDMEESKSRYQVAAAQELVELNALQVSQAQLEKMVGKLPVNLRKSGVYDFDATLPEPNDIEVWKEASKKQNLKILSAELSVRISELEYDKAYARHYPTVELNASYQNSDQPSEFLVKSETARVGIDVNVPIYQGGLVGAESRRLLSLKDKVISDKLSAEKDSEILAVESFLGVVGGLNRIDALKQAIKSSEITLKGMVIGQQNGLRTNTDVLNAQQQLFSARRDLQKERYDYLNNRLKLKASVGGVVADEILVLDSMVASKATYPQANGATQSLINEIEIHVE
jgi:outer membrane protein